MSSDASLCYLGYYSEMAQLLLCFVLKDIYKPGLRTFLPAGDVTAHKLFRIQCSKYLFRCLLCVTVQLKIVIMSTQWQLSPWSEMKPGKGGLSVLCMQESGLEQPWF